MNSILQCFSNLERLRIFLLEKDRYKDWEADKQNKKLSFALAEIIKKFWKILNHRFYAPNIFKDIISENNYLFKGISNDVPKELILFILENLHKELNNANNQIINNNQWINNRNFLDVYNNFINHFKNRNNSIISDEFYEANYTETFCGKCNTVIYYVQSYNILFFPLDEVRKFMNYYNHIFVRINDCFEFYQK